MATRKADVGLTPKQEQALVALLNEPTIERAAKTAGVGERTLHRWLDEPIFSRAYLKSRREAFSQAIAASLRSAPVAVQTLAKIMADATLSVSARVSAATALLKFSRESFAERQGTVGDLGSFVTRPLFAGTGCHQRRRAALCRCGGATVLGGRGRRTPPPPAGREYSRPRC